jgi:hypothetical protein
MLDRLISINDRIPLSPYVTLPLSLILGRIPDRRSFFVDFRCFVAAGACIILIR